MDNRKIAKKKNPAEDANLLSSLLFWYTRNIFRESNKRDITLDDICDPLKVDASEYLGNVLEKEWNFELEKKAISNKDGKKKSKKYAKPSLTKALIRMFFWQNIYLSLIYVLNFLGCCVSYPIFQGWVINYFNITDDPANIERDKALIYASYLILTKFAQVILLHHGSRQAWLMGMRANVACCSLIYRKTLHLNKSLLDQTTAGQVVNLLSNDVSRFDLLFDFINMIWITPIQIMLIVYIMWDSIGGMLLVGITILLIMSLPLQSVVIYVSKIMRAKIAVLTDTRVQLISEIVSGIQVVKMYAWEKPFEKIVRNIRLAEMKKIKTSSQIRSIFFSSLDFMERVAVFVTIVLYVFMGNRIDADTVFVVVTYFNILQLSILLFMPRGLIAAGEVSVSIKRIEGFLLLDQAKASKLSIINIPEKLSSDEISNNKKLEKEKNGKNIQSSSPVEIAFQRVSANWISGQLPPTLNELTFKINAGNLCAISGNVGSGKSAILNLLLKELPLGAGTLILKQQPDEELSKTNWQPGYYTDNPNLRISYACQDAWLFSGTVRENILFGQVFDPVRYNEVTEVCALRRDFEQLPRSDLTIVGERGASLSGGQRARINLARAVYRQADLYLLDDPLSAVDPRVGRHIFDRCICSYLNGKTRVLVTHQLQFLRKVDAILFLERGAVKYYGSYNNITNLDPKVMDILGKLKPDFEKNNRNSDDKETDHLKGEHDNMNSINVNTDDLSVKSLDVSDSKVETLSQNTEEENEVQRIHGNFAPLMAYFRASGSWCILGLYVLVLILSQVAGSSTDSWLGYWTNIEDTREAKKNNTNMEKYFTGNDSTKFETNIFGGEPLSTEDSVYIYTGILSICTILCLLRSYLVINICVKASRRLHDSMLSNILQATMNFFNKNSSGRILNRFSKDTGSMDESLPRNFSEAIQIFSTMIGILVVIIIINYWMIIPLFTIGILFLFAKKFYLNTSQQIRRLETAAKSPVFLHLNATLSGLPTIRSFGREIKKKLTQEFDHFQDERTGAWFLSIVTTSAFGIFLDTVLVIFNAIVVYTFILMDTGTILAGSVGLALSQVTILTGMVQYGFRLFVGLMTELISVERIIQYTNLPQEHPLNSPTPLPEGWPRNGRIIMKNVSMRYEENQPLVLKKLNVNIEPGWKVGIVGRTGAGKSSIIAALFRLSGKNLEGEIIIDGIDISHIGLQDLRTRISIIPQEPVLFSQSLRYNLDPFGQYDDTLLWDALQEVELNELSLDQQVTEKGSNFSVGQRQLICLARAIIRQNSILVLDEATANIDTYTDTIIQNTIRRRFAKCTVLTVAHRLNTIIDSDRIIVMDNGSIKEFGPPHELCENKNGHFSQMIEQTGETMAMKLKKLAEQSYQRNKHQSSIIAFENSRSRIQEETQEEIIQAEESYDIRL